MKRFPPILSVIFLLLPGLMAFSPIQQTDVSMQIAAGIGGWYRAGQWIPLHITVESENTSVDGQLQVRVATSTASATQF